MRTLDSMLPTLRLAPLGLLALAVLVAPAANAEDDAINPFQKDYLSLEVTRNYPVSFSQDQFEAGGFHPAIGYRHNLDAHWLMGLSAGFKLLHKKEDAKGNPASGDIALWTFSHDSYYALRLDHPNYLLVGPRLMYMLPVMAAKVPFQRDEDYRTEIGIALSMMLTHVLNDRVLLTVRFDRWRGTATMRFHGVESAFGISYSLP